MLTGRAIMDALLDKVIAEVNINLDGSIKLTMTDGSTFLLTGDPEIGSRRVSVFKTRSV